MAAFWRVYDKYMPDSGEKDYVLIFEPLPEETQTIHLLSPTNYEGNTYDISLIPQSLQSKENIHSLVFFYSAT